MTNSRPRVRRRQAPGDDIEFYFLQVTNFFQSVWMQQGTGLSAQKGWMLSKANKLHGCHTYNIGVHSCSGTSTWLYDGPHTGCAFELKCYHLKRRCVGTSCTMSCTMKPTVSHQGFPSLALLAAPNGKQPTSELRPWDLPRLARPKGCFASYYARSIHELLGRIMGRLGNIRQDSAHAIEGTVELAPQYSN